MILGRDGGEDKDKLGKAGCERRERNLLFDQITRFSVNMLGLPKLVLFDEIDSALGEVTALDFERRHAKVLKQRPECIAYTATKVKQHD